MKRDKIIYMVLYLCAIATFIWVMYASLLMCVLLSAFSAYFCSKRADKIIKEKYACKAERQFYYVLNHISASLSAGYTLENCLKEISETSDEYDMVAEELNDVYRLIKLNYPVEHAFRVFAEKMNNADIKAFSISLEYGILAGVNLVDTVRYVSSSLRFKYDTEDEIKRVLNLPVMNNRIMMCMPFICIYLFNYIAPSYTKVLYTPGGHIVMTVVLLMILIAWWIGDRICRIEY